MQRNNLPTYAIVELLMRLAHYNSLVGDYKDHRIYSEGVMVKTSGGTISFPSELIMQQFENPEMISENQLLEIASSAFSPVG
ncbi:MAG TPA: hypothetical protein VGN20_02965 [Mucilaginibacter sp.]|jgi:hypothetical protein